MTELEIATKAVRLYAEDAPAPSACHAAMSAPELTRQQLCATRMVAWAGLHRATWTYWLT